MRPGRIAALAIPWLAVGLLLLAIPRAAGTGGYYRNSANRHSNTATGVLRDAALPRGSCNQCHDQHLATPNDFCLFTTADNTVCATCHTTAFQRSWTGTAEYANSAHGASTLLYDPAAGAGTGREVKLCVQCHDPHGNGEAANGFYASLQRRLEERTCNSNNSAGTAGTGCHGNVAGYRPVGSPDVYTQFTRTFTHLLTTGDPAATRRHSSTESQVTSSGAFSGTNRHVECTNCHNPHLARAGRHTAPTNVISPILLGAWGVEPSYAGVTNFVTPTTFTAVDFNIWPIPTTHREYTLCLKCHSYFAYGATPPAGYTDQSREFNPNNAAYHMTIATAASAGMDTANAPFVAPWTATSQMYCSDCHGSNVAGDAWGPHGSNTDSILPATWDGTTGDSVGAGGADTSTHLCFRCHPYNAYVTGTNALRTGFREVGSNQNLHAFHMVNQRVRCWNCHTRIPHGWKWAHAIAQRADQPTYPLYYGAAAGNMPGVWVGITTWRLGTTQWNESDCDHNGC